MRFAAVPLAMVAALAFVATAYAHAEPSTVMPGDGAVLATSPGQIVIETTQNMARQAGANDIVVVDASGKVETTAEAVVDDTDRRRLTQTVPASLPPGVYTIKWKTLSADDGDAADGTFSFTIDPSKPPSAGTVTVSSAVTTAPNTAVAQPAALQATAPDAAGSPSGTSWVLVVAVGVAALAVGAGGTFLFVTKSQS